ncbi:serine hydroxymethyltransferase [Luteimonas sp. MC1782]|uniref:serine hydroxymethyltransferase n=1 Tax=Luteimonas sp. MC1782 TaxID=2760305 RepID=UPI001603FE5F|nr:serine hydroxymethyltransferase [Luteimonas sp. MC1782]MBB1473741.1 serine hydroxymethyltransferase [Luteimonas sp. MC1782]
MFPRDARIEGYDPELAQAIANEGRRQEDHVELIASENYASPRVMEAQGSKLTNKYAEGYPGKRYYGGCEYVDVAEQLALDRVKQLFAAGSADDMYANVQPHSGSQANQAVYLALLQPGDTILGMSLAHGGHLTHGAKVNISGKLFKAVQYGVDEAGMIDYDEVERLAVEHKPKMVIAGFSAYSQVVDWARFRAIADKVGAYLFVDMAHVAGLVAAGVYPNPVPHAHIVTSTTHKTLRGPRGGIIVASRAAMGEAADEITKKLQSIVFPGIQGGPLMHVIAAKAVAFKEALEPEFKAYQQQVVKNAQAMAKVIIDRGYKIVSGGTENHLMLVDMIGKGVTGKAAEEALGRAHITVNKNAVPNDPQKPFVTSGLRLGTPAVTTRGYLEADCVELANWICDVLDQPADEAVIARVRENVTRQCARFPVYG